MKGLAWLLLYLPGFNPLVPRLHLRCVDLVRFGELQQSMRRGKEMPERHPCTYWVEAETC
jgi:hypothetical protein